jgi:amino acid transporter
LIAYKDIRVSSILTMIFEGASVACITALAFVILFKHGFKLDSQQLSLSGVNVRGMGLAVVACIFSLVGFEAATTMGAEAKNPRRNVPRAVIASLLVTGAFMVFMAYVEVGGTSNYGAAWTSAPLNYLADVYNVSYFKIPVSIGAMVSFFSLSLSCLNSGSRIIYPMARHGIFSGHLGRAHATNRTPHIAVTVYIALIFALLAFLMIFTNPLTAFGDAGTLAAFGFLVAYYLITVAAPRYLYKLGQLNKRNVLLAVIAVLCLLVPTIGSFYPLPPWPVDLFPYIFLTWMAIGGTWLFIVHKRQPGVLPEIEADLERAPELIGESIEIDETSPEPALA